MGTSVDTLRSARLALCTLVLAALAACGGGRGHGHGLDAAGVSDPVAAGAGETVLVASTGATAVPPIPVATTMPMPAGAPAPAASSPFGALGFDINGMPFAVSPCAEEGGKCVFSDQQTVAYGANGIYVMKRFTGGANCNNVTFGDAIVGVSKRCFLALVMAAGAGTGASAPSPAPVPPTATPTPVPMPAPVPVPVPVAMPASPAFDPATKPTKQEASRFLVQATFGPTLGEIDRLAGMSYSAWLEQQFASAPMDTYSAYVTRGGPLGCNPCTSQHVNAVMEAFWMQAVRGQDQLRQRAVLALSETFVISTVNSPIEVVPVAFASYFDMLSTNAFGNFRTLLEQVATHPSMGLYLSHMQNEKEDPATGRLPDENFAREVMQLFTIGLWQLNDDGTRKKDANGNDIATYSQAEIMGMAKVFTGLSWDGGDFVYGDHPFNKPMVYYPTHHSGAEKRIVRGVVIPSGTPGPQSIKIALDTLFNHPNVGPFIGSQLIKRLVTSNPSPAYVRRVSAAFADNGSGVRGDMKTVLRAVLLDPEARDAAKLADPTWGKLREPMVRYANFMRAFDVKSTGGVYKIWNLEDTLSSVGQNPMRAPSVFNWFRPDYAPPGAVAARGLVAPEFQITHETTTTGYANFMASVTEHQNTWFRDNVMAQYGPTVDYLAGSYAAEMALARTDTGALMDRLNLLFMSGQMTAATRKVILDAVNATPADADTGMRRVAVAVFLITQSPEFIVQK